MKRVLLASFYFPPYAEISGVRASKFCKFLPEFGWEPWVVTVDKRYYGDKILPTVPAELNSVKQIRFPFLPIPAARTFASLIYPLFILWVLLKNRKHLDAVYMIGSPFHPFLLTPVIKNGFRIPVGLDFRDSWSSNFGFDGTQEEDVPKLTKSVHCLFFYIEKIALKFASFATFATSTLTNEYTGLIPEYKNKYHTIFNGYDRDDFLDIAPVSIAENKTIILTGKFHVYTPDAVAMFLSILAKFPGLTFLYIGSEENIIRSLAQQLNVSKQVVTMGYQPYKRVLQFIAGSDYCLTSTGMDNGMGTKIFDYIALGKPTLCLIPEGSIIKKECSDIPNILFATAPHSQKSIEQGLATLLALKPARETVVAKKFTRRHSAEKLAALLTNALVHKPEKTCG